MAALVFPDDPSDGDTFLAPNGVTYTYDSVDDSWTGKAPYVTSIYPSISDISATPDFVSGTGTEEDPFIITPLTVAPDGSANSTQYLKIVNQPPELVVKFSNLTQSNAAYQKFRQPGGVTNMQGSWEGYLVYDDTVGMNTTTESTYVGILNCGAAFFSWTITQQV